MPAKALSAALVAQEVAVAVTKKLTHIFAFLIIFLGFQNCAVDLNSSTPGAAAISCSPSPQVLQTFLPIMTGTLQNTGLVGSKQGCANCHVSGSGAGSFKILTGTTPDIQLTNFCSSQSRKARLAVHPTESSHQQVYSASDIANLINWVSTLN
jgi:hypothetical protein